VYVERAREGSVSHEDEEGAGSPLGLVGVLARLPLATPGGGLLGALALHRQPAAATMGGRGGVKIESIDRSVAREREKWRNPHLASALATPLDFAPFMADSCANSSGGGQIRERRIESVENRGRIGRGQRLTWGTGLRRAEGEGKGRGKGEEETGKAERGIRRPRREPRGISYLQRGPAPNPKFELPDRPTTFLTWSLGFMHDMWGPCWPEPGMSYSDP
jgi:hypothetical protein